MNSRSARYLFDGLVPAAEALELVLLDARKTASKYRFGGLTAQQVLQSGLLLEGELDTILPKLDTIPGAVRYDE